MKGPSSYPNPQLYGWSLPAGVAKSNPWYSLMRRLLHVPMCALWKVRVFNRRYEPTEGGAVYICNHQSFLDPMLMSFALRRPMNYMARDSLFRVPGLKHLIGTLNTFPVRRGTADMGALRESMRRLKAGGQLVIFAEGTRTLDGKIAPFMSGVSMLSKRAAKWTVPVVIDGAFECWPRWRAIPSTGSIVVRFAKPIPQEDAKKMSNQAFAEHVRKIIIDTQTDVRKRIGRAPLDYA